MTLKHHRCLNFFLLILLQYTNIHTQNVLKKTLMSRKHSCSPCLAVLTSISFIVCCNCPRPFKYIYILKTEATGSSCHCVVLSSKHTSYTASRRCWDGRHVVTWPCRAMLQPGQPVQDEGKKAEITVWSRSSWHQCARSRPRGEEQDRIAWVSFELSV